PARIPEPFKDRHASGSQAGRAPRHHLQSRPSGNRVRHRPQKERESRAGAPLLEDSFARALHGGLEREERKRWSRSRRDLLRARGSDERARAGEAHEAGRGAQSGALAGTDNYTRSVHGIADALTP